MNATSNPPRRAGIYARMSMDRDGDRLGVTRQVEACQQKAAALGWEVVAVYEDNDRSATSGKVRERYAAMLEAVERGEIDGVITWAVDRLTRTPIELEHIITLAESTGVRLATCSGDIDLGSDQGRLMARVLGAFARGEVERKGARQRAANDQRAEAGLPYKGPRAFGWEPDGVTVREVEARELREAARRVLRGESLASIARDWNGRGLEPSQRAKRWTTATVKHVLLSARNRGLRQHRGQVIGPASWPAIIDADTATAVAAILTDPSRRRPGPPRRYLLSGVLRCDVCAGPVTGAYVKDGNKGRQYRCLGHVHRNADRVDEFVRSVVVARLSQPDALSLFARKDDEPRIEELRAEAADIRTRQDGIAEAFAAGHIDLSALSAGTKRLRDRAESVEDELANLTAGAVMHEALTGDDVGTAFDALPMETQRAVIDALVALTLERVGSGRRGVVGVRIEWKAS